MNRKIFYLAFCALLFAVSASAQAQQGGRIPRLGLLLVGSPTPPPPSRLQAFLERLHELGYVEGKTIIIERRFADGKEDRLPDLAIDLIRLKVDVVVAGGGNAVRAAKNATKTVPI